MPRLGFKFRVTCLVQANADRRYLARLRVARPGPRPAFSLTRAAASRWTGFKFRATQAAEPGLPRPDRQASLASPPGLGVASPGQRVSRDQAASESLALPRPGLASAWSGFRLGPRPSYGRGHSLLGNQSLVAKDTELDSAVGPQFDRDRWFPVRTLPWGVQMSLLSYADSGRLLLVCVKWSLS